MHDELEVVERGGGRQQTEWSGFHAQLLGSSAAKITLEFIKRFQISWWVLTILFPPCFPRLQADQLFHTLKDHSANEDDHWEPHIHACPYALLVLSVLRRSEREDRALGSNKEWPLHCQVNTHWLLYDHLNRYQTHPDYRAESLNGYFRIMQNLSIDRLSGITESDAIYRESQFSSLLHLPYSPSRPSWWRWLFHYPVKFLHHFLYDKISPIINVINTASLTIVYIHW